MASRSDRSGPPDGTLADDPWPAPSAAPPAAPPHAAGAAVGECLADRYELTALLGEGGMGSVYRAHDRLLGGQVAVKLLRETAGASPQREERLLREAQVLRRVAHPSVLRLLETGRSPLGLYLVTELVEGEALSTRLERQKRLPPDEVHGVCLQLLAGLEAAHAAGVVHRDLKPANVLCEAGGRLVLADFGIARNLQAASLTRTGAVIGTLDFMAPEQLRGEEVDARADLFALGGVAHALLTGHPPGAASRDGEPPSPYAVALARLRHVPRLAGAAAAGVPGPLRELVDACLRLDPGERPQTVAEARRLLEGGPAGWRRRRRRRLGLALGAAGLLAGAVAAGLGLTAGRPALVVARVTEVHPPGQTAAATFAATAAQDLLAEELADRAPRAHEPLRRLELELSRTAAAPGAPGRFLPRLVAPPTEVRRWARWVVERGSVPSGVTLVQALEPPAAFLRAAAGPPSAEDRLRQARARWRGGRDEAALVLLGAAPSGDAGDAASPADPATRAEMAVLRALVAPPGSATAISAAREAAATATASSASGLPPRLQVLARAAVALSVTPAAGEIPAALAAADELAATLGGDPELELVRHRLRRRLGHTRDATAVLEQQLGRRRHDPLAHLELARHLAALADPRAAAAAARYLELKPGSAAGQTLAGELSLKRGDRAAARDALARVETIGPPEAATRLGGLLALHEGDLEAARQRARRGLLATLIGPRLDALEILALADLAAGQPAAAMEQLRTAASTAAAHDPERAARLEAVRLEASRAALPSR